MRKQLLIPVLTALLVGSSTFVSCVDDKYDLSDVDMTLQIGNKEETFTLPKSSTSEITLSSLFDIKPGSAIEERADGSYFVNTSGKADPTTINVKQIEISKPDDDKFNATLDLRQLGQEKPKAPKKRIGEEISFSYRYDISELAKADIKGAHASDISAEVVEINRVGLEPVEFELTITITGENKVILNKVSFENLKLKMPTGLEISECTFKGQDVFANDDAATLKNTAKEEGVIDISKHVNTDYDINSSEPLKFTLKLEAVNVDGKKHALSFDNTSHTADFTGSFNLEGEAVLTNEDLNTTLLATKAQAKLEEIIQANTEWSDEQKVDTLNNFLARLNQGDYHAALDLILPQLNFDGKSTFKTDGEYLVINQFTGKIHREIDQINPIELNDLPQFLTEDGVTLDLYNPQIFLKLALQYGSKSNGNTFRENLKTSVLLNAYQNNNDTPTGTTKTGDIIFEGANPAYIREYTTKEGTFDVMMKRIYSNKKEEKPSDELIPTDWRQYKDILSNHHVPSLDSLLLKVPNRVKVMGGNGGNIAIDVDCKDVKLPQNCTVNFDYKVFTPISFGEKFSIVYKDTVDGWAKDFEDLEKLDFQALEFTAKMKSKNPIPLKMILTAIPIYNDNNHTEIKDIEVNSVTIPANCDDQDIKITLQPKTGHKMNEFFKGVNGKKLDGIVLNAVMKDATKGLILNAKQNIQLENVQISIKGGVKYDAN